MAKKKPVRHIEKSGQTKAGIKPLYRVIAVIAVLALIIFLAFPDLLKKHDYDEGYHFKKKESLLFILQIALRKVRLTLKLQIQNIKESLA